MDKDDKILNLLGFAAKKRCFVFGKDNIRNYIRSNGEKIVLIANDTGETTREDVIKRCNSFDVNYYIFRSKSKIDLSSKLGKMNVSIIGIEDKNLVKGILDIVKAGGDL